MKRINATVNVFVLTGFSGDTVFHYFLFIAMFLVYLVILAGNLLIIALIWTDYRFHSPMYYFLVCLSFMEIIGFSTVALKLFPILILTDHTISREGCIAQSYIYFFSTSSDFLILSIMSIDRFVAICYPLRYSSIMRPNFCIALVGGSFAIVFFCLLYPTYMISRVPFCGKVLDHFFCDTAAMLKLICVDISLIKLSAFITSVLILFGPLLITSISYAFIFITVLNLRSTKGHRKTFSTCVSHIAMVSIVFGSAIFIEIRPSPRNSVQTDKAVNLLSTVLSPLLNPFIYTLRNQKVKDCLKEKWKKLR